MTTSTLTVTDFVLARIAEDEAAANRIAGSPMNRWPQPDPHAGELGVFYDQGEGMEIHTARVLAQCAAMRKIVDLNSWVDHSGNRIEYGPDCAEEMAALASIWSDHPDFREEWKVSPQPLVHQPSGWSCADNATRHIAAGCVNHPKPCGAKSQPTGHAATCVLQMGHVSEHHGWLDLAVRDSFSERHWSSHPDWREEWA